MRGVARGAARSLLVTPWFAAGAGFVLAAGLWIYSPHTELRFPSPLTAPDDVPCKTPQCSPENGNGQLATSAPGKQLSHRAAHGRAGRADVVGQSSASSGLTFIFSVPFQQHGGFQAVISVRGRHVPAHWRLEFTMPGTHIRYVFGARWQALPGGDGGTAFALQRKLGGGGQGGGQGYGQGPGRGRWSEGGGINFLVAGTGTASTPKTCIFDGSACTFD
jgi:hypothetical protein